MIDRLFRKLSKKISIDLGTAHMRVMIYGDSEVIIEPSVVAFNKSNNKVLAIGEEAKQMIGRTPSNIVALQPIQKGVISDFEGAKALLGYFIRKVRFEEKLFLPPQVMIAVPSITTEVEINAVMDAAKSSGASNVYIVEEPVAAAIGMNIPIENADSNMVVDIGGGTTDIAILSLGGVLTDSSIKSAGDEMDHLIAEYIKSKYNLKIGIKFAEDLKKQLADFDVNKSTYANKTLKVKGQDLHTGLPKAIDITSVEISEAILPTVKKIIRAMKESIEKSSAEIVGDLINNGIYLTGGGSMIKGLDKFIHKELQIDIHKNEEPLKTVVKGMNKLWDNSELLNQLQVKDLILK